MWYRSHLRGEPWQPSTMTYRTLHANHKHTVFWPKCGVSTEWWRGGNKSVCIIWEADTRCTKHNPEGRRQSRAFSHQNIKDNETLRDRKHFQSSQRLHTPMHTATFILWLANLLCEYLSNDGHVIWEAYLRLTRQSPEVQHNVVSFGNTHSCRRPCTRHTRRRLRSSRVADCRRRRWSEIGGDTCSSRRRSRRTTLSTVRRLVGCPRQWWRRNLQSITNNQKGDYDWHGKTRNDTKIAIQKL